MFEILDFPNHGARSIVLILVSAWKLQASHSQKVAGCKTSVLLVTVWVVDELPVNLLSLLGGELLLAHVTLELPIQLDANMLNASITRLGSL